MPIYHLVEYSLNYMTTSGTLWQFFRDESTLNNNVVVVDFNWE